MLDFIELIEFVINVIGFRSSVKDLKIFESVETVVVFIFLSADRKFNRQN